MTYFVEFVYIEEPTEIIDPQLFYYLFKISDMLKYPIAEEKVTMMGTVVKSLSLIEKFNLKQHKNLSKKIKTTKFWDLYYRHNNYFHEKNKLLESVFSRPANKTGFQDRLNKLQLVGNELVDDEEDEEEREFIKTVVKKNGILSRWGMRASSLNDIIRFMVYMRFSLELINTVCSLITEMYDMDKKVAYHVFKETEDEFTIRDYVQIEAEKQVGLVGRLQRLVFGVRKAMEFLEVKDAVNLMLVSKQVRELLREDFCAMALRTKGVTKELRPLIWYSIIPDVSESGREIALF